MKKNVEKVASVSSKGQVTIPSFVRDVLDVDFNDAVIFKITKNGVLIEKDESSSNSICPCCNNDISEIESCLFCKGEGSIKGDSDFKNIISIVTRMVDEYYWLVGFEVKKTEYGYSLELTNSSSHEEESDWYQYSINLHLMIKALNSFDYLKFYDIIPIYRCSIPDNYIELFEREVMHYMYEYTSTRKKENNKSKENDEYEMEFEIKKCSEVLAKEYRDEYLHVFLS